MKKILILCLAGVMIFSIALVSDASIPRVAKISYTTGKVEVQRAGTNTWIQAKMNMSLYVSDQVRTAKNGMSEIMLDDGSIIRLKPNSNLEIMELVQEEKGAAKKSIFGFSKGKLWSKVTKMLDTQSKFEVRTPTAIAGVRGTQLSVWVTRDLATRVSVFAGSVEVKAIREEMKEEIPSVLVGANQSLNIGVGIAPTIEPLSIEDKREWKRWDREIKQQYDMEVTLDKTMEQARASITQGIKDADYQLGKSLIDVHGNRVRMEEYLLRPQPDQLKFLILNTRANRFDYAYSLYAFNKNLPDNFSPVVREIIKGEWGSVLPENYLTSNEAYFSNSRDYMSWKVSGGGVAGTGAIGDYYRQGFATFEHKVNDTVKIQCNNLNDPVGSQRWSVPSNVGSLKEVDADYSIPTGFSKDTTYAKSSMTLMFEDGTWEKMEFWAIDDLGNVLTWAKAGTGQALENDNGEVRLTAKEFNGRDIDVVYSPKILIDANKSNW